MNNLSNLCLFSSHRTANARPHTSRLLKIGMDRSQTSIDKYYIMLNIPKHIVTFQLLSISLVVISTNFIKILKVYNRDSMSVSRVQGVSNMTPGIVIVIKLQHCTLKFAFCFSSCRDQYNQLRKQLKYLLPFLTQSVSESHILCPTRSANQNELKLCTCTV